MNGINHLAIKTCINFLQYAMKKVEKAMPQQHKDDCNYTIALLIELIEPELRK
jgi:hypothetical protein